MKKYITNALVIAIALGIVISPLHAAAKVKAKANPADPNAVQKAEPNAPAAKPAAKFVASKDSPTFHKADCKFAKRINEKNKVEYATREDAIKAGKQPCKVCKP